MNSEPASAGGIAKVDIGALEPDVEMHFTRHAELRRLIPNDQSARVAHVIFSEGANTHWHHHHGLQLLWFFDGEGEVSTREGESLTCSPGDLVSTEPNVSHRHGAAAGHTAGHLAITIGATVWEGDDI